MTTTMPIRGQLNQPHYRADIDGMRAIAVLAVLGYHAFPGAVPGGFVGVDVFFVISGFLISSILLDQLQRGTFSLAGFYARRIRRILPALSVVLAACAALGWLLLQPDDYRELGRELAASALFVPNWLFWNEAGYFDAAAELKPLLHLWSLGVEEQFYLVWPLLLWLFHRRGWPKLVPTLAIVVASFVASVALLQNDSAGAFYLPHSRFWELLLGAALAQGALARSDLAGGERATQPELRDAPGRLRAMLSRSWPDVAASSGALLLLGSFFLLTRGIPFPGAWALPPVIGTCLLVAAGPRAWLNRHVLSQPAMVFFGLISYPLYLWHWPLLSFARLAGDGPPSVMLRIALLLLSVLLAWITWRVIERPVRSGTRRRWKVVAPLGCMAAAAVAGIAIVAAGGFDGRLNADVRRYANYAYDFEHDARSGTCWLAMENAPLAFPDDCIEPAGHGGVPLVVVWGDSHAARLTPGVRAIGRGRFRVAQFTRDGCRPFLGLGYPDCLAGNAGVLQTIRRLRPDYVVLFSFWTAPVLTDERALLDELQRTIAVLNASGVGQVIVVGPSAEWAGRQHALPRNLIRLYEHKPFRRAPARTLDGVNPIASRRDAAFAARLAGRDDVHYFSAYHAICNRQGCMTRAGDDPYELMTWDYGHLTTSGATYVARRLEAEIGGFRPHAGARAHLHAVDAITGRH